MSVLEKVWLDRTTVREDGKRVPTFWHPIPLSGDPDEVDMTLMAKLVALGLNLELPVGELIDTQIKRIRGLQTGLANQVLKAAVSDEGRHHRGMTYAQDWLEQHGVMVPTGFVNRWMADLEALPYHPITVAALLEVTLFLPFLALMRLKGGQAFNRLALGINEDEQRHTVVNASLAAALKEPLPTCDRWLCLRDEILDWVLADCEKDTRNLVITASDELFTDLDSPSLNRLNQVSAITFMAPFEVQNRQMYGRTLSENY